MTALAVLLLTRGPRPACVVVVASTAPARRVHAAVPPAGSTSLPGMFNVGGGELVVIFLVALIFLGPQRLPGAARQVGKFMADMRRMSNGFQSELRNALDEPLQA